MQKYCTQSSCNQKRDRFKKLNKKNRILQNPFHIDHKTLMGIDEPNWWESLQEICGFGVAGLDGNSQKKLCPYSEKIQQRKRR